MASFYQLRTVSPYTLGFLPLVYTSLQQGREAHWYGVASPREETLPLFVPLKIVETPPALSPLEIWAFVNHCYWWVAYTPQGLGQQKKKKKNENKNKQMEKKRKREKKSRLLSLWLLSLFVLSIFISAFGIFCSHISPFGVPTHFCWFIFTRNSGFVLVDPRSTFSGRVFGYILYKAPTLNSFSPCLLSTWFSAEPWEI